MNQTTFAAVAWEKKGKITRRERFLAEMDAVIPWARLLGLIEPHYPKAGNGTQPKPMEQMLRIYFMQNWFVSFCNCCPIPSANRVSDRIN